MHVSFQHQKWNVHVRAFIITGKEELTVLHNTHRYNSLNRSCWNVINFFFQVTLESNLSFWWLNSIVCDYIFRIAMVGVIYNEFSEHPCTFDDDGVIINVFAIETVRGFTGCTWRMFVVFTLPWDKRISNQQPHQKNF